ncbi:hypothetical protein LTR85_000316 [Meristemomyces frigidus]|nr:hypothetical protein LTR85_000316 [Meristemomyces frigidus]
MVFRPAAAGPSRRQTIKIDDDSDSDITTKTSIIKDEDDHRLNRSDQNDLIARTSSLKLNEEYDSVFEKDDSSDDGEVSTPEPGKSRLSNARARRGRHSKASPAPIHYRYKDLAMTPEGESITRGDCCELIDGDFIRVKRILEYTITRDTLLRGILLRRSCLVDTMLRKSKNELCAILTEVDPEVLDPALDDYLVDIPAESVLRVRSLILTNRVFGGDYNVRKFADLSFRDDCMEADIAHELGVLVCRWKRVEYGDPAGRKGQKGAMLHLGCHEADPSKGIPDAANVYYWRELAATDGVPTASPPGTVFDLTSDDAEPTSKRAGKRPKHDGSSTLTETSRKMKRTVIVENEEETYLDVYGSVQVQRKMRSESLLTNTFTSSVPTLKGKRKRTASDGTTHRPGALDALVSEERTHFDICCGAGGMATGAERSGSVLKFLLDMDADACNTVRLAFPDRKIKVLNIKLHQLFHDRRHSHRSYKVVTAHISYPCKTLSGAHTGPVVTARDLENEDTGASVDDIVKATRMKVVSFEQTSHMVTYSKNRLVFRRLIRDLTFNGYSVRWRIVEATEHGSASKRERLIMLASCPGHPLPGFPPARAGPKKTAADIYREKPRKRDLDPWMLQYTLKNEQPWDPNTQVKYTITCDGGKGDLHPSGQRTHDMQELAQLAGFPPERKFAAATMTSLREQIGNAVPACLAYDVYCMVHKALDQGETEMMLWLTGANEVKKEGTEEKKEKKRDVIVLDDDEEDLVMVDKEVIVID